MVQQLFKTIFSTYCYYKSTEQNPTDLDIVWYNFINFFPTAAEKNYEKEILTKHLLEALQVCICEEKEVQCLNSVQMGILYFVCFEFLSLSRSS